MTHLTQICATSALATLLATSTAMADVTALEVWDDWQSLMARTGAQVDFEQSSSDGILTINNLSITATPSDAHGPTINLGSLVFQQQNDGSVMVLLPTDAPIVLTIDTDKIILNQSHKDLSLVISGTPKNLTYSYKAAALSLKLVELIVEGENITDWVADLTLNNLNGITHSRDAALKEVTHEASIGALSYRLGFNFVDRDAQFSAQGSITDLKSRLNVAIPENIETLELQGALNAGLRAIGHLGYSAITAEYSVAEKGTVANATVTSENGAIDTKLKRAQGKMVEMTQSLSFGPTKLHTNIDDNGKSMLLDLAIDHLAAGYTVDFSENIDQASFEQDSFQKAVTDGLSVTANAGYDGLNTAFSITKKGRFYAGNAISASAGIDLFLDRNQARYTVGMGNTNAALTTPNLPIGPLEFSVSEARTSLVIPLNVSKTPAPFSYSDRVINLSISENLWAMFDPDKLLPRDAVTYILNIEGMGNWLIDPFSEGFQDNNPDKPKGELHSLTLNELQLSAAGGALTGVGAFTFDNDDLETFDGFPAPTGTLDLKFVGLNRIMDALIELGLIDEEQAFGARLGLGLFTVAGDGDDTLISHIETTDDGHVLANGKRLK